jgi:cell division protein FtsL
MAANKRRRKLNREAFMWLVIAVLLLAIPICEVYVKAKLSESNIALEEIKEKINEQEGINESLRMEINELASLDKIQEVANEIGLTYNNSNVKVVINE